MRLSTIKIAALFAAVTLISGCAGTRTMNQEAALVHLDNSDYKAFAAHYLDSAGAPKYDPKSLLDSLEAGKAFNDAGMWQLSSEAFEAAGKLLAWKADTIDTPEEVVNLIGTTLTSDAFGAYQGKIHQGSLIDYYQAINMLMLGRESDARVDFNRLEVRQSNASAQLKAYVKTLNKSDTSDEKQNEIAEKSMSKVGSQINDGTKHLPTGLKEAKIRNAAGDVMSAMFRASSSAQSDKSSNIARDMLKNASGASASKGGQQLVSALDRQLRQGKGSVSNKVIVLFEDGRGPSLKEFRIDLPLFILTNKVTYSGIALPQFQPGKPAFGSIMVSNGKKPIETVTLTDINELAGLEFQSGYSGTVAKAVMSTIIKTTAQAVIIHQVEKESGGNLFGEIIKLGVGAAQYAITKADTRSWINLPNTLQIAVVERPANGLLTISTSNNSHKAEIELPEGDNAMVLIKASGILGSPAVYTQSLPAQTIVAGL